MILLIFLFAVSGTAYAQQGSQNEKTFIYILKLTENYWSESNWTEKDSKIVGEHFSRLKDMFEKGTLIFAGKSDEENKVTFGIVIYKAASMEEAELIAKDDPAVKAGIMSVSVHPFNIALSK